MKNKKRGCRIAYEYGTQLLLSVTALLLIGCLTLNPLAPDSGILLERIRPTYWQWLGRVKTAYTDGTTEGAQAAPDGFMPYCTTKVSKEGFAGVTHEDLRFYLKTLRNAYPSAGWAALRFTDGTGIEFPGFDISKAAYGVMGSEERVDKENSRPLETGLSLAEQIDGATEIRYKFDEYNNPVYELHLDKDGNAAADSAGVAEYYREYDNNSNIVWEKRLGTDGLPAVDGSGTAEFRKVFDGKYLLSEAYFDGNGSAVNLSDKLYSRADYTYDASHNVIGESYFDSAGKPVLNSRGYASVKRKFDDRHVTREAYYGTDSEPAMASGGYASFNRTYDGAGNVASESYYGSDGKPCICNKGYAAVVSVYDGEKNVIEQGYLGTDGKPSDSAYGYAKVRRTYEGGRILTEAYEGEDGAPAVLPGRYSSIRQKWEGDVLIEREYLDSGSMPAERTEGYSKAVWARQENGVWNVAFKDLNGNEVKNDGLNLVTDVKSGRDGWSEWMEPNKDAVNYCFNIGSVNLGNKAEGDLYTCSLEIEFKDVEATGGQEFRFWTQGAQDGGWGAGNVWNGNVINLTAAPENGVYSYSCTSGVSGEMVNMSRFNVGFRCDYWAKGKFRVRNVKIEKGDRATAWTAGL